MAFNLCGSFGFGNVGDEAVPIAISQMLDIEPTIDFNIIGRFNNPALENVIGIGDKDVNRRNKIRGNQLVFSGGGIIENNYSCSLFKCEDLITTDFSSSSFFYAVSVEPYVDYGWNLKRKLKRLLKDNVVYVRDVLSAQVLSELLPKQAVELIGDSVLWASYQADINGFNISELPLTFIAVTCAPRWQNDKRWVEWMARQLVNLSIELKVDILFVPMSSDYDDDRLVHKDIANRIFELNANIKTYQIVSPLSVNDICGIFEKAELVISMRLHGCVMAYAQKTPFIGLAYHPKLFGFAKTVGWESFLIPGSLPTKQSRGEYGYGVKDISRIFDVNIVDKAVESMAFNDFSKLEILKQKQFECMKKNLI